MSACLCAGLLLIAAARGSSAAEPMPGFDEVDEIVVTSRRRDESLLGHAGNIDRLGEFDLESVRHRHIHELFTRVPGTWISRGSGQEHLTAIRSPVLTGPGSCGAFLFLEDGIPTRPSGFCNVNQLFESNTELARSIEIIRGPGTALHGSNALHGIVNVRLPESGAPARISAAIEAGANEFLRLRAALPFDFADGGYAGLVYADDGGFRDDSGYRQAKGNLKVRSSLLGGEFVTGLSFTDLDQETAGFIVGEDAYKDPEVNRSNPNPEAFREASSVRLYGLWNRSLGSAELDVRPYARYSDMRFLQHFLPGQPLEENGHVSTGFLSMATWETGSGRTTIGFDLEWSDVWLRETQDGPTGGSGFLNETRPEGKHYDFEVQAVTAAPYIQFETDLGDRATFGAGLRAEYADYRYDNRMLDGNTRDDGTECGFGGCLYTRPADRSDSFTNLAPTINATWRATDNTVLYGSAGRGFRAPQVTELYRLQNGQTVADLDSERIDSVEIGIRQSTRALLVDLSVYAMRKKGSVYRDAEGFSVSGGRSTHEGAEIGLDWQLAERWRVAVDAGYGRHKYDFDTVASRGETFVSGRDVDTAPRWLASAELFYRPLSAVDFALQWTTISGYYLDAENQHRYPGHDLYNLRGSIALGERMTASVRLLNLLDTDVADRADFAFGNFRYFPGRGRELFVELVWSPERGNRESL